ncbi:hypothetical protein predicted by Glimmer/Critica [Sorangium cellulosum So ce56]|uniref:Uncharacterized protein n=1 Tax=Sorangium cellulosum (strain So ce56) TaxID=448385 RepID=A9G7B4_SORC5|nr:hypothetical protein predicted by Glimmer/Critica [Sorangium cellulosum So ce56]
MARASRLASIVLIMSITSIHAHCAHRLLALATRSVHVAGRL